MSIYLLIYSFICLFIFVLPQALGSLASSWSRPGVACGAFWCRARLPAERAACLAKLWEKLMLVCFCYLIVLSCLGKTQASARLAPSARRARRAADVARADPPFFGRVLSTKCRYIHIYIYIYIYITYIYIYTHRYITEGFSGRVAGRPGASERCGTLSLIR